MHREQSKLLFIWVTLMTVIGGWAYLTDTGEIFTHPSGEAVYITDEACIVNDVEEPEYSQLLNWCKQKKDIVGH